MQFAEMDSAKGPRCGRTNCITYFRVLPKLVGGLTGQMGCAVAKPRSAVVARKVRPIQVGGMGGLVGFPRQLSLVLVTIAGVVFSGAAPCQHGRGGCPAHGQCRAPPALSSLVTPPFRGLEGRAARRGEKRSLGICPGNGPLGVGPSVTAVVILFC